MASASEKGIIFRMRFTVNRRRQQSVECMHPIASGKFIGRLFKAQPKAVGRVGCHAVVLRLPIAESRVFCQFYFREHYIRAFGNIQCVGSPVVASQPSFEQGYNAVGTAFVGPPFNQQVAGGSCDVEPVFFHRRVLRTSYDNVVRIRFRLGG